MNVMRGNSDAASQQQRTSQLLIRAVEGEARIPHGGSDTGLSGGGSSAGAFELCSANATTCPGGFETPRRGKRKRDAAAEDVTEILLSPSSPKRARLLDEGTHEKSSYGLSPCYKSPGHGEDCSPEKRSRDEETTRLSLTNKRARDDPDGRHRALNVGVWPGLENPRSYCFAYALVQCLASLLGLMSVLQAGPVSDALRTLCQELVVRGQAKTLSVAPLLEAIGHPLFDGNEEDVSEFFTVL